MCYDDIMFLKNEKEGVIVRRKNILFLLAICLLIVAGCNTTEKNTQDEKTPPDNETETEENKEIADIFQKTADALSEINSLQVDTQLEGKSASAGGEYDYSSYTIDYITLDPFIVHSIVDIDSPVNPELTNMEVFVTDNAVYVENTTENEWVELGFSEVKNYIHVFTVLTDMQFLHYKEQSGQFSVIEEDGLYELSFEGNNESYTDTILRATPEMLVSDADIQMNPDIDFKGTITIYIDKETYLPTEIKMTNVITEEIDGNKYDNSRETVSLISKYNETDDIDLPEEILN